MAGFLGNDFYNNKLYVIFEVGEDLYAVQSNSVLSIQTLNAVTKLPKTPKTNRGVITYLGQTVTVVDTRVLMGMLPYKEELEEFMFKMERAHEDWLGEFEKALDESLPFSRELLPDACEYGKWYRAYKTNNYILRLYLNDLEEVHTKLHQDIASAAELAEAGNIDGGREILEKAKEEDYAGLVKGFRGVSKAYEEGLREIALICKCGRERRGFLVDKILSVERLKETTPVPKELENIEYVVRLAYQQKTDRIIKIVDADAITMNLTFDFEEGSEISLVSENYG